VNKKTRFLQLTLISVGLRIYFFTESWRSLRTYSCLARRSWKICVYRGILFWCKLY